MKKMKKHSVSTLTSKCKDEPGWRVLHEDWRDAFWNVTRDYFSPITTVTKNFIEHIEPERRKRAG
jgi:hypothetical protein